MANKKTIQQLEADLDRYMRKANYNLRKATEARDLIKKIRKGQVKQPAPAGVKVMLSKPSWPADFDDQIPSFGSPINPAIGG